MRCQPLRAGCSHERTTCSAGGQLAAARLHRLEWYGARPRRADPGAPAAVPAPGGHCARMHPSIPSSGSCSPSSRRPSATTSAMSWRRAPRASGSSARPRRGSRRTTPTWPYSFVNICQALGSSPGALRAGLRRWRDAQRARALRGEPVVRIQLRRVAGIRSKATGRAARGRRALALVAGRDRPRTAARPPDGGHRLRRRAPAARARARRRPRAVPGAPARVPRRPGRRRPPRSCAATASTATRSRPALAGVHTAYYLVHSLGARGSFEEQDRRAARHFAQAARAAGFGASSTSADSATTPRACPPHLRSRHETGDALRCTGVPVIEFRASIILGSGSLSYELIRALVERLPVDAVSALGADAGPADRHRGRRRLPAGGARPAARPEPDVRDRRRRPHLVRRHHARVRPPARPAPPAGSRCPC